MVRHPFSLFLGHMSTAACLSCRSGKSKPAKGRSRPVIPEVSVRRFPARIYETEKDGGSGIP
jgi:hypothetical protein